MTRVLLAIVLTRPYAVVFSSFCVTEGWVPWWCWFDFLCLQSSCLFGISLPCPPTWQFCCVCTRPLAWQIVKNGDNLWNVRNCLFNQVGCCTRYCVMAAVLIFIELWKNSETVLIVRPSGKPFCFHPLPREDESHPLLLSWWDAGNVLAAILAMPFQLVDGGSVLRRRKIFCCGLFKRPLIKTLQSCEGRNAFLCSEVRHGWEWCGLGQGSAGFPNSWVSEGSGCTLSVELFPELALLVSPSHLQWCWWGDSLWHETLGRRDSQAMVLPFLCWFHLLLSSALLSL